MIMRKTFIGWMLVGLLVFVGLSMVAPQSAPVVAQQPQPTPDNPERPVVEQVALRALNQGATHKAKISNLVIIDRFALIGWLRGEAGGNMLLKKERDTWQVVTSGGGALGLRGLLDYGVPRATAEKLLDRYDPTWRQVPQR